MTQNATIKTLTDLQKLAIVADYINSLLEKQQQLESDSELINYHTKRLAKLNILRQVLQQKGNQSLDAKYGMNLGTKLGRRILYIMDNVNKLCSNEIKEFTESNDARIEIDTWLVVSVLFGIYEYFNKNKANLPRDIVNCDLVNLENKITSMKVQLSEKLYFQVNDFDDYRYGLSWDKLKSFLPNSIYTSNKLRNIYDHCGYDGKKKQLFEDIDSLLLGVFNRFDWIQTSEDDIELQKFIESMIEVFIEYCPPIAIDAYLIYAIHGIEKELSKLKKSNNNKKRSLGTAIPETVGWLPQTLIDKAAGQKNK